MTPEIRNAFDVMPVDARAGALALRGLILDTAADTPQAGRLKEALRWGQPAYLTPETRSGTTIRIGTPKFGGFALYVHCQTSLIDDFRELAGDVFRYDGQRGVLFNDTSQIRPELLLALIRRALTYNLRT